MPRSRSPERYPPEFFEAVLVAQRAPEDSPLVVPCASVSEAFSLRTKFYAFFRALEAAGAGDPAKLAARLESAGRLGEGGERDARDLLLAAANIEPAVRGGGPTDAPGLPELVLAKKSQNRFALRIRAALDSQRPSADESYARLQGLLKTQGEEE